MSGHCEHAESEVRFKIASNGQKMVSRQCLRCGNSASSFLKKADWPEEIPPWDEELSERYWQSGEGKDWRRQLWLEKEERSADWWRRYHRYMESEEWRAVRRKVWQRENGLCQGCREVKGAHVHHLTYERLGEELLTDLVLYCEPCHEKAHGRKFARSA